VKIWHGTLKRDLVHIRTRNDVFAAFAVCRDCDTVFTNGSKVGALYLGAGDGLHVTFIHMHPSRCHQNPLSLPHAAVQKHVGAHRRPSVQAPSRNYP
jgi:hypothetical protein